jgi:hypothetical protein
LAVRDARAEAIADWAIPDMSKLARLAGITQRTLIANGCNDIPVPAVNSYLLADHIPNAELISYPDAGHGFLFQYPHQFAAEINISDDLRGRFRWPVVPADRLENTIANLDRLATRPERS